MTKTLADQLDIIIEKAPKLRAAGIVGAVTVDGVKFSVGLADDERKETVDDDDDGDPLLDPATYGFRKGGKVPTLKGES